MYPLIGHNGGPALDTATPDPVETLVLDLEIANVDATVRARELTAVLKTFGDKIETADQAHNLVDLIAQMGAFTAKAEDARKTAKAPHDALSKACDGFFKPMADDVKAAKETAIDLLSAYMRGVAKDDKDKATIRTDLGQVASLSDDIGFTIDAPEAVPLEYWKIDETAVRAAVKKAVPIAGVTRIVTRKAGVR